MLSILLCLPEVDVNFLVSIVTDYRRKYCLGGEGGETECTRPQTHLPNIVVMYVFMKCLGGHTLVSLPNRAKKSVSSLINLMLLQHPRLIRYTT